MLVTNNELYKIKDKVEFDYDLNKWTVPPFILKNKEISFPKIANAMNLVEQSLEERELCFTDQYTKSAEVERNYGTEKKFSFDRPSASIMSGKTAVIPRNKVVFNTNDSQLPDSKVTSPFQKGYNKHRGSSIDSYSNDEFNANMEFQSSQRKDPNLMGNHMSTGELPIKGRVRQESEFTIRKGK